MMFHRDRVLRASGRHVSTFTAMSLMVTISVPGAMIRSAHAENQTKTQNQTYDRSKIPMLQSCDAACEARRNQPLIPRADIPSPVERHPAFDRPIGSPCTPAWPCR
jgi:hypothetical protein